MNKKIVEQGQEFSELWAFLLIQLYNEGNFQDKSSFYWEYSASKTSLIVPYLLIKKNNPKESLCYTNKHQRLMFS